MEATENKTIEWNTYNIIEGEIEYTKQCRDDGEEALIDLSDDDIESMILNDAELFEREWEYTLEYLDELLKEFNAAKKDYLVKINDFGWRKLSCETVISGNVSASDFLQKILPDTECAFKITFCGDCIEILNSHHDAPTGENYKITLIK